MGLFRSLAIGLFILAVPVALLATNIRFAASEHRVYDYSIREYDAASVSGIPEAELLRANRELIGYFTADAPRPLRIEVRDEAGQTVSLFNARETAHLADVRDLFQAVFTAQTVAVAVLLTLAVLLLAWWPVRALAAAALCGSLVTVGLMGLTGLVALAGFHSAWDQFHLLAFSNDLWRLDPTTDHLIQMFPEPFWRDVALFVGALSLGEAVLIAGAAGGYLFITRPRASAGVAPAPRPALPRPALPGPRSAPPGHRRRPVH